MKCATCGNQMHTRKVDIGRKGPLGKRLYTVENYCGYCDWSGVTGPGAMLRQCIKEMNSS